MQMSFTQQTRTSPGWPPPWNPGHAPPSKTLRQSQEIPSAGLPESNAIKCQGWAVPLMSEHDSWLLWQEISFPQGCTRLLPSTLQKCLKSFVWCPCDYIYSVCRCFISSMPKRNVWLWCSTSLRIKWLYRHWTPSLLATVFTYHEHQRSPTISFASRLGCFWAPELSSTWPASCFSPVRPTAK